MRHLTPESILSIESAKSDDASSHRRSKDSSSTTPASTAPQSSNSSVKSAPNISDSEEKPRLKSILRMSKSTTSLATVRFSIPEPPPAMPEFELARSSPQRRDESTSPGYQPHSRASLDLPARPPARLRVHKRLSAPAPISRRESKTFAAPPPPPSPHDPRIYSQPVGRYTPRVTSFLSVASAPAALESPPTPSNPPSQYNPLQHYLPCLAPNCSNYYTAHLLGPTFYLPQSPYQLIRKRGLCPFHAEKDLKLGNQRVKNTYESMRQNCGRKTLGAIAAEFEVFVQQVREERAEESKRMKAWQRQRVLPSAPAGSTKGKEGKDQEKVWEEEWDWRFSPRPCTRKGCESGWYSPFDSRLYLFYTTPRPSGFTPLSTLCPGCAKDDVASAEERIDGRRRDVGGLVGPEWEEWYVQMGKDRDLEVEYWESAQERIVKEEMERKPVGEVQSEKVVRQKKNKRLTKLDICVVM